MLPAPPTGAPTVTTSPTTGPAIGSGPASVADLAEGLLDAVVNISTSQSVGGAGAGPQAPQTPPAASATARTLGEAEIEMIREALAAANGNISVASKRLGISRNTIYRKLRWGQPG